MPSGTVSHFLHFGGSLTTTTHDKIIDPESGDYALVDHTEEIFVLFSSKRVSLSFEWTPSCSGFSH